MITFSVIGDPKGQPRPRAFVRNGHARVYDAGTAEGWKGLIAAEARKVPLSQPLEGPLKVTLRFTFRRPKSHYRTSKTNPGLKDSAPPLWREGKPDAENAAKAVLDALTNLMFWRDDAQVALLIVEKQWAPMDAPGGCWIEIEALEP